MVQVIFTSFFLLLTLLLGVSGEQCGTHAEGAVCPEGLCCSRAGYCGSTDAYCCEGCQSQCHCEVRNLITEKKFEEMLMHRNDDDCPAKGFYTYDAFISAAEAFPNFATTGDPETLKREIAAFFGQTSHQTSRPPTGQCGKQADGALCQGDLCCSRAGFCGNTDPYCCEGCQSQCNCSQAGDNGGGGVGGGWASATDVPYSHGYCLIVNETNPGNYCAPSTTYPCAPGEKYYGRGPMQLTWNDNYGQCGEFIGEDLLNNPDLVETDPVISFKTAIWFWMTPQPPKPSCHAVINESWSPSDADIAAGRKPGYGVITNIINGTNECGNGPNALAKNRIGFYQRYCQMFEVGSGEHLDCNNQLPFENGPLNLVDSM